MAIAKNILKRCYESDEVDQFQYRILEYNTTPVAGMRLTPSELFFGRLIKTKLPVVNSKLTRNNIPEEEIKQKREAKILLRQNCKIVTHIGNWRYSYF